MYRTSIVNINHAISNAFERQLMIFQSRNHNDGSRGGVWTRIPPWSAQLFAIAVIIISFTNHGLKPAAAAVERAGRNYSEYKLSNVSHSNRKIRNR